LSLADVAPVVLQLRFEQEPVATLAGSAVKLLITGFKAGGGAGGGGEGVGTGVGIGVGVGIGTARGIVVVVAVGMSAACVAGISGIDDDAVVET
jgi:hypothetical protein